MNTVQKYNKHYRGFQKFMRKNKRVLNAFIINLFDFILNNSFSSLRLERNVMKI